MSTYREHNGIGYDPYGSAIGMTLPSEQAAHRERVAKANAWLSAWAALPAATRELFATFSAERKAEIKAMTAAELTAAFAPVRQRRPARKPRKAA